MSQFYFNPSAAPSLNVHPTSFPAATNHHVNNHGARSRRGARFGSSNHPSKHIKPARTHRETAESAHVVAWRKDFEAARSFDLEDDEVFCPWHLLTEDDVGCSARCFNLCSNANASNALLIQLQSISSSSSERSSSSGGSPDSSPVQPQAQPTPNFTLSAAAAPHMPASAVHHGNSSHLKIHQPLAQRTRNAIPIVDPNSRNTSPPTSISPGRQVQKPYIGRRW